MEEAPLTKFASKIIVHRRTEFRASKIMQKRVFDNPKIEILWNHSVVDMIGEPVQGGLTSPGLNILKREISEIKCDGLFLAIGPKIQI